MPTFLSDLDVSEISLVDRPANPGASVMIFKRAGDGGQAVRRMPQPRSLSMAKVAAKTKVTKRAAPVTDDGPFVEIHKSETEIIYIHKDAAMQGMGGVSEQADGGMGEVLAALHQDVCQIVQSGADPESMQQAIDEIFQQAAGMMSGGMMGNDQQPGYLEKAFVAGAMCVATPEEIKKAGMGDPGNPDTQGPDGKGKVGQTQGNGGQNDVQGTDGKAKVGETTTNGDGDENGNPDPDDTTAGGQENMSKLLEDPVFKALSDKNTVLETQLAEINKRDGIKEIEARLLKAHQAAELAPNLYEVMKTNKDAFEAIMKGYEAAGVKIAASDALTTEIGKKGGGDVSDFQKRADTAIEVIMKADPKLTRQQAYTKALKTDPDLAAAYNNGSL